MTKFQEARWATFVESVRAGLGAVDAFVYVGIDPGSTGAFAFVFGKHACTVDMPTVSVTRNKTKNSKRNVLDAPTIVRLFDALKARGDDFRVMAEHAVPTVVGRGPAKGAKGSVTGAKGSATGRFSARNQVYVAFYTAQFSAPWELFCAARGMAFAHIAPSAWKKRLKLSTKDKSASIRLAQQLFPGVINGAKADHNRAEALLLAHFARLEWRDAAVE